MQVMEYSRGQDSALGITLAPASVDALMAEIPLVKRALLDWKAKYNGHCARVMFTVVSAAENHAGIESILMRVYQDERDLSPLLKSVNVDVALLDMQGKPVKQYSLAAVSAAVAVQRKPWWRFW